jgi:hypothetical protein
MRLLSEIGSARAAIAASYLSLWRSGGTLEEEEPEGRSPAGSPEETPAPPPSKPSPKTEHP